MKEWSEKNWFNSFNSAKGLLFADHYKAIIAREFLPPIEASIDPICACNLACKHCNASLYLQQSNNKKPLRIPDDHLLNLIDFLGKWGIKAICFGGGGSPTLHTFLPEAIIRTTENSMESSVATNGTIWSDKLMDIMANHCRWVGVSVDAGCANTYMLIKGRVYFPQVLSNIKKLVKLIDKGSKCDVSYKFLISCYNENEIFDACKIAKELGVKDFHARPGDFWHQGRGNMKNTLQIKRIKDVEEQFEKCHELEDEHFRVCTVIHKFNPDMTPKRDFSQCYAAPLMIQICPDKCYFCADQRYQSEYVLGSHYPDPYNILTFWGKERHQELVFGNTPQNCHNRCTYGVYCKQVEELFTGKDPMCVSFP